jgi:hypothetical protein
MEVCQERKHQLRRDIEEDKMKRRELRQKYSQDVKEYEMLAKKSGSTIQRKQEAVLMSLFPESDQAMDSAEEKDYKDYKTSIPEDYRQRLENTDNFLLQVCALQYMPGTKRVTKDCPYGTVPYMNAKIKQRVNNKIQEIQLHPPLTVQWDSR